ncbi:HAD domain-containing protein [Streptomyces sp. NPDC127072]|uniref:HAD domain-containing protein n=1 Tax=Streptomyces sp. NPDC127072 TaxID=3347129 RepID=UPI00365896B9
MTGPGQRPLLFLDVDGPLIPFGAAPPEHPDGHPTYRTTPEPPGADANPLVSRINPEHGPRLAALPCELIWATTWMADANEIIAPRLGLPELPVVTWPDPSSTEEQSERDVWDAWDERDERAGLHWKTRPLVTWAAGRAFIWADDEITDADRTWVSAHHRGRALLHRVDPSRGLTDADYAVIGGWLRRG